MEQEAAQVCFSISQRAESKLKGKSETGICCGKDLTETLKLEKNLEVWLFKNITMFLELSVNKPKKIYRYPYNHQFIRTWYAWTQLRRSA